MTYKKSRSIPLPDFALVLKYVSLSVVYQFLRARVALRFFVADDSFLVALEGRDDPDEPLDIQELLRPVDPRVQSREGLPARAVEGEDQPCSSS